MGAGIGPTMRSVWRRRLLYRVMPAVSEGSGTAAADERFLHFPAAVGPPVQELLVGEEEMVAAVVAAIVVEVEMPQVR